VPLRYHNGFVEQTASGDDRQVGSAVESNQNLLRVDLYIRRCVEQVAKE